MAGAGFLREKESQCLAWLAGVLEGKAVGNKMVCLKAAGRLKQGDQMPTSLLRGRAPNLLDQRSLFRRIFCKDRYWEDLS